jgi:hypothetical protein
MFGFLPAPCGCFSGDERSVYRAHFCGLCNALRHRYGLWSRLLVNRDGAFLSLLGSALCRTAPHVSSATCCNPLGKPRLLVQSAAHVDYAAAVTVCGLAVKLEDDADDEPGLRGRLAAIGHSAMHSSLSKAVAVLETADFPVGETLEYMRAQKGSESAFNSSPSDAARQTRLAYANIFAHLPKVTDSDPSQAEPLRELGGNLGELIYIADAWDDHAADRKRGRFNPLPDDFNERRDSVMEISEKCISGITTAFGALQLHGIMPLTRQLLLFTMPVSTRRRFQVSADGKSQAIIDRPLLVHMTPGGGKGSKNKRKWWESCDCSDCDPGCCECCDCGKCHCHSCDCHACDCHGCDCPCDGCDCSCH